MIPAAQESSRSITPPTLLSQEALEEAPASAVTPCGRRPILVIYVGGTIGMKKNAEGALEPCAKYLTNEMRSMRELKESTDIASFDILEYEQLLDSSDMHAADYLRVAADVRHHYDQYDGFVIAHGTDTMHYTASALSFLLYNLAKPVILTGAMVPLAEPYNDARRNLIISMMIASRLEICEVCIFFNDSLFRGNRCDKIYHTFGAFQSSNYPALGRMEPTRFVLREEYLLPQPSGAMMVLSNLEGRVMVFPLHPDADDESIVKLIKARKAEVNRGSQSVERAMLDGVVLILTGTGSPTGALARVLKRIACAAATSGVLLCVTARELNGALNAKSVRHLREVHPWIINMGDMSCATAEIKMMYLFGKGLSTKEVAELMPVNMRGEVTPSTVARL